MAHMQKKPVREGKKTVMSSPRLQRSNRNRTVEGMTNRNAFPGLSNSAPATGPTQGNSSTGAPSMKMTAKRVNTGSGRSSTAARTASKGRK